MTYFMGQIEVFGGNFAPSGAAFCDGQLLAISQNDALFSLLGTTYGGDGRTTFGLPDLRGGVAIGDGAGPGLTPRALGSRGGVETVSLAMQSIPSHTHALKARDSTPVAANDGTLAKTPIYAVPGGTLVPMEPQAVQTTPPSPASPH